MRISIHHFAENELEESAEYYSKARPGLGADFLDAIDAAFDEICESPYSSEMEVEMEGQRRKVIRRFPFSIYYTIHPGTIRILSIAHQSREPYYWSGRS